MPLPYRWLTALMVRYNGSSLLIDCGEGTQIAIKEKGWSFKPIDPPQPPPSWTSACTPLASRLF